MLSTCPVCASPHAKVSTPDRGDKNYVACPQCGNFGITHEADASLSSPHDLTNRQILSAVCRYHAELGETLVITVSVLGDYLSLVPPPLAPPDALDALLIYIGEKQAGLSEWVVLTNGRFPIQVTRNPKDYEYLKKVLVERKLLETRRSGTIENVRLSIDGWHRYYELRSARPNSRQAFVAMWFADELTPAWNEGIRPGLEDLGYAAVRLDAVEHNEKIDDRIIAEIRRSGLVVADLTGGRANVYFEAGFAMGLGIPIIWTCRKDDVDQLHFDTRQYNYIDWSTPADLRERLRLRIEATLPRKAEARR